MGRAGRCSKRTKVFGLWAREQGKDRPMGIDRELELIRRDVPGAVGGEHGQFESNRISSPVAGSEARERRSVVSERKQGVWQ